jgi:hypothetical protein
MEDPQPDGLNPARPGLRVSSSVTLIVIPLMIVVIWLLENYLLAGTTRLFQHMDPPGLVLYTALAGILVGIIIPLVRIRAAFLSGAVNIFQIGFRSARRTGATVILTAIACGAVFLFANIPGRGPDPWETAALFLLLLPVSAAAVMICWALVGTHIQAYVRCEGVIVSVITGVVVTSLVFALSLAALIPGPDIGNLVGGFFAVGCITAFFFFAVRDIYASIIVVTSCLIVLLKSVIDPAYLVPVNPVVVFCGSAVIITLLGIHGYFSRHYTTIMLSRE